MSKHQRGKFYIEGENEDKLAENMYFNVSALITWNKISFSRKFLIKDSTLR